MESEPFVRDSKRAEFDRALASEIEIVRGEYSSLQPILSESDDIIDSVDYWLPRIIKRECGERIWCQQLFLREPFYRVRESQLIRNWIF